ncbi:hypothetical protein ATG98_2194 [Marinobacter sp. LV10R520-4]|uniref:hypothetical protein n=1 Tax=Marinobacter sp. LV10R520-4 TaxID=1761796 RepID=UPI000BF36CBD|nr:hypothetical protein [Marinobacter sp. LV10R520-4]PFG53112.1 hypothetical protein ATG98_2194 [Marinobacter sp. LV10R520-4]
MGAIDYLHLHGLDADNLTGDQIAVWPEISITPEIENWIIQHKQELITELRQERRIPPANERSWQNPDAMLMEIAVMLRANPDHLYALLCEDDIQDIADEANSRAYMLDYFRLMRTDGKLPIHTEPPPAKATEPPQSYIESAQAWKPAHEAMMNHVTGCTACRAPQGRYCNEGADLRRVYLEAHQSATSPPGVDKT